MTTRKVGNLLALAVLSYLTQRPMHPYELQRSLKENDAARTFKLSYGALYSVVRRLAEAGFIEEHDTLREGNLPERTVYRLTEAGRHEIDDWLRELLAVPQSEHPAFVAALSLIVVLAPQDAADMLGDRLGRLEKEQTAIVTTRDEAIAGGVHPVFLIEDDYRLRVLEAETAFVRDLIAKITRGDWVAAWAAHHSDTTEASS